MELPEIIGSTILLLTTLIILLLTFAYVIYKIKNQTRLQPGFNKVQRISAKTEPIKVKDVGKDQLSEPVFGSVDGRVQFSHPKATNRFEVVNENLQLKNKALEERNFN